MEGKVVRPLGVANKAKIWISCYSFKVRVPVSSMRSTSSVLIDSGVSARDSY